DGIRDFHVTGVQTCALPISERIDAGFAILSRGIGVQSSALGKPRIDGTPLELDYPVRLVEDYFRWGQACQREGLEHAMVMDVLEIGRASCRERGWLEAVGAR